MELKVLKEINFHNTSMIEKVREIPIPHHFFNDPCKGIIYRTIMECLVCLGKSDYVLIPRGVYILYNSYEELFYLGETEEELIERKNLNGFKIN